MSNYCQAPILEFNKDKDLDNGFYSLPIELTEYIFQQLNGKNGNAIKLIIVLLGKYSGFKVTQDWVLKHTGLTKDGYYKARQTLINREMLIFDEEKNQLIVNVAGMLKKQQDLKLYRSVLATASEELNQLLLQEA